MQGTEALSSMPPALLFGLGALIVVQIVLDVIALIDLYKRPKEQLAIPNKWVWLAIILLVNTIGAIVYLAIARKAAPAMDVRPTPDAAGRAANAADLLYGEREQR